MREDNHDRLVEELLDAALANLHGAEPRAGLEERVLANLRQQPRMARAARAARLLSLNSAPVMIAAVVLLSLFAADHLLNHRLAAEPPVVSAPAENEPRVDLTLRRPQAAVEGREILPAKRVKASPKQERSPSHRRDLAVNLNLSRADEEASDVLRIEEVRIAEVRLDDIVISNSERHEWRDE